MEARKILREVAKMGVDTLSIDLELYYAECSLEFLEQFGDLQSSATYEWVEKIFRSAQQKVIKSRLEDQFGDRMDAIAEKGNMYSFDL